ncbi:hypothetical protein [Flammeovirga aprica]|uniref:Uncharacterized protein n=1 Tax=Flammeovirga aprica JL-4 TaxID=694437 RepID=A0A7X9RSY2_9BACT|nr:hypothetical protein [Flammeovirga aprica]NME66589.1 hypothetical protein [Flammeovirga aprica JL-4]
MSYSTQKQLYNNPFGLLYSNCCLVNPQKCYITSLVYTVNQYNQQDNEVLTEAIKEELESVSFFYPSFSLNEKGKRDYNGIITIELRYPFPDNSMVMDMVRNKLTKNKNVYIISYSITNDSLLLFFKSTNSNPSLHDKVGAVIANTLRQQIDNCHDLKIYAANEKCYYPSDPSSFINYNSTPFLFKYQEKGALYNGRTNWENYNLYSCLRNRNINKLRNGDEYEYKMFFSLCRIYNIPLEIAIQFLKNNHINVDVKRAYQLFEHYLFIKNYLDFKSNFKSKKYHA